jgi:rare lipoprotein A
MSARILLALGAICAGAIALFAFPERVQEKALSPKELPVVEHGIASYYGDQFQGRTTASGEPHDQNEMSAASRDLPLGSHARVTNLENGKSVDVEINDRGPYVHGRIIDLSKRAAKDLGIGRREGLAHVIVQAHPADQPTPELKDEVAHVAAEKQAKAAPPAAQNRRPKAVKTAAP